MTRATKKTVALMLPNLELGGAQRQALALARSLPRAGWRPVLLVAEWHGPFIAQVEREGFCCYRLDAEFYRRKISPLFWMNLIGVIRRARAACRKEKASVLQSFLFWQNVVAVPTALVTGTVRAVLTGRRNMGGYKDRRFHYQLLENLANVFTDAIVCNSQAVMHDAARRERFTRGRLHTIPNAVVQEDAPDGHSDFPELRDAQFVVGTVGNMKRQKRHDVFIRAIAEAMPRVPGLKAIIVGRDLGEETKLRKLCKELGVQKHVIFAGSAESVAPWYRAFDVFVLSSDFEGMPNVVMEAMAAGCATVSTRAGGAAELITDGVTGLLVDIGDHSAIAKRIVTLAGDAEARAAMGEAASETIRAEYSPRRLAERHVTLYESILR